MFKFDSELAKDEMDEDEEEEADKGDNDENEEEDANKKMSVSLEDLKDALNDDVTTTTDNDSESDFKECSSGAYGDELRCGAAEMPENANSEYETKQKTQVLSPLDLKSKFVVTLCHIFGTIAANLCIFRLI